MNVRLLKAGLIVDCGGFVPHVVAVLGMFNGREYNKKTKLWTVPVVHVQKLVETLGGFGFVFDPAVEELYKRSILKHRKSTRIKSGEFKQSEQVAIDELGLPMYVYQQQGGGFLAASDSALCGDQPGTGKTIQSISATRLKRAKKVLIFCPVSMKQTWKEELEKWAPLSTSIIVGGTPVQRTIQWGTDVQYYICNYHLLLRDVKTMQSIDWDFIIADEATALANPRSKTAMNIKKIKTRGKIALTGTPLSNSVEDVWSLFDWTHPGLLGSYWQFIEEYCVKDKFGSVSGYKNLNKLKEILEPYMIRRLKKDVLTQLPPKIYENIYVDFSPVEHALYNAIKEETLTELKESGMFSQNNLSQAIVKFVRLAQMADSSELINGDQLSSKLDALKELLAVVLANDEKAIIFTQFREMAIILERELAKYSPLLIVGGIAPDIRDSNRVAFNTDDTHRLLIMTSAGAMGLNLQRATVVIHYDMPWSISMTEQREDRAHRNGQIGNVLVYRMLVRNTIDEYKLNILHKKKNTSGIVLGDNDIDEVKKIGLTRADLRKILN